MKSLALIILTLVLTACGESKNKNESTGFVYTDKRGTEHQCTVIDTQPCGLLLACESGGGFHQCVSTSL